jgi:glucose-6-phosphate 1-dehydrogenase
MKRTDVAPTILIIYGITGDLAKKKLLPALYELEVNRLLPEQLIIFGTSRREINKEDMLKLFQFSPSDRQAAKKLISRLRTVRFDITNPDDYPRLASALEQFGNTKRTPYNLLHYLAVPPQLFGHVIKHLGENRLNKTRDLATCSRLIIEKPFGWDLASAKHLAGQLGKYFKDDQIYQVDHYLAKETVQNILAIRRDNPWLKELWSGKFIKEIHIKAYEKIGVEWRTDFYEQTGALRDMVQSHLLHLLATVAMPLPTHATAKNLASARTQLLKQIKPLKRKRLKGAVRAQYRSYRKEVENPESTRETFASIPLTIDRALWRHTKIRLTTGKSLDRQDTSVEIVFSDFGKKIEFTNSLTLRIQPREGFTINIATRKPGWGDEVDHVHLDYTYPSGTPFRSAYASVLFNVLTGDRTIFPTNESILAAWRIVDPLAKQWAQDNAPLVQYRPGVSGEKLLETLLEV